MNALQLERARISERYGERHPEYQKVATQLADTEQQYDAAIRRAAQSAKGEYEGALAQERSL